MTALIISLGLALMPQQSAWPGVSYCWLTSNVLRVEIAPLPALPDAARFDVSIESAGSVYSAGWVEAGQAVTLYVVRPGRTFVLNIWAEGYRRPYGVTYRIVDAPACHVIPPTPTPAAPCAPEHVATARLIHDATLLWDARDEARTDAMLSAGQTVGVIEWGADFARVVWACGAYWLPVDALAEIERD